MMKISRIMAAALAAWTFCSSAHADGECDKYTTSYDRTYCFSKLFVESDKELNEVYKALGKQINADVREDLKIIQRKWMKYRDNVCQPESGTINVDCNYRVNRERTEYLRDRLRECKAGTCRPDMIAQQSW